jgi:hypothetical protein
MSIFIIVQTQIWIINGTSKKKRIPPLFILSHWSQACHTPSVNDLLPTFPLSLSLVTFSCRSYTTFVIDYFVTVNCWLLFSHLPKSLSLIIEILQIILTFWHCSMLAHPPLSSQSLSLIIGILQIIHSFLTLLTACSPTPLIIIVVTDQFILQIRHRFGHLITFLFHRYNPR